MLLAATPSPPSLHMQNARACPAAGPAAGCTSPTGAQHGGAAAGLRCGPHPRCHMECKVAHHTVRRRRQPQRRAMAPRWRTRAPRPRRPRRSWSRRAGAGGGGPPRPGPPRDLARSLSRPRAAPCAAGARSKQQPRRLQGTTASPVQVAPAGRAKIGGACMCRQARTPQKRPRAGMSRTPRRCARSCGARATAPRAPRRRLLPRARTRKPRPPQRAPSWSRRGVRARPRKSAWRPWRLMLRGAGRAWGLPAADVSSRLQGWCPAPVFVGGHCNAAGRLNIRSTLDSSRHPSHKAYRDGRQGCPEHGPRGGCLIQGAVFTEHGTEAGSLCA